MGDSHLSKLAEEVTEGVAAGQEVNTEPTEGQKQAGNYKKGHIKIDGLTIKIETPFKSVRSGVDDDGNEWSQKMWDDYGYILRPDGTNSTGYDYDPVDVFINPAPPAGGGDDNTLRHTQEVYVVNQMKNGKFDEHKCMIGYSTKAQAKQAYLQNYESGWDGCGTIIEMPWEDFKEWAMGPGPRKGELKEGKGGQWGSRGRLSKDAAELNKGTPHIPENFDVHEELCGGRLKVYTGGNDWETGYTCCFIVDRPNYRLSANRVWVALNPPEGCDDFGYITDSEKAGGIDSDVKQQRAKKQFNLFLNKWKEAARKDNGKLPDKAKFWAETLMGNKELQAFVKEWGYEKTDWKPSKALHKVAKILLDIEVGDKVLVGRFRNKPVTVESIGTDSNGQPTINGRKLLALRIAKLMPKKKRRSSTSTAAKNLRKKGSEILKAAIDRAEGDKAPDGKACAKCGKGVVKTAMDTTQGSAFLHQTISRVEGTSFPYGNDDASRVT